MRPLHALLLAAIGLASFGYVALSMRQDYSRSFPVALSSRSQHSASAIHHAPGISGHWGGAVVAAEHRAHDTDTLAGSVTSWDAYLYGSQGSHAAQLSAPTSASTAAAAAAPVASRPASLAQRRLAPAAPATAPQLPPHAPNQNALEAHHARPSCVLQPSLFSSPSRICPRVFSPVCGCNGVVYSNKCESELAGVPHVGGAYCEMSFGQPLVLKGHVRAHAFGSSTFAPASAGSPPRHHLAATAAAPPNFLPSTLSLLRRERNKLIQRERSDRLAIARLRTADDYDARRANTPSNVLLSAKAAIDNLHAQDKAARHDAARKARIHALRLDEAANRRVARLLEEEERAEERHNHVK